MSDQTIPEENPPETPDSNRSSRDTEPPPETHGFLEQFQTLSFSAIEELKTIVEAGLTTAERMVLIRVSLKLLALSAHNMTDEVDFSDDEKREIETLLASLPIPLTP